MIKLERRRIDKHVNKTLRRKLKTKQNEPYENLLALNKETGNGKYIYSNQNKPSRLHNNFGVYSNVWKKVPRNL